MMKSRFKRAMLLIEMFFGHSASQARVLVQLPNPSSSILDNMAFARRKASGLPCGSKFNWLTFAETNNIAELEQGLITQEKLKTERFKRFIDKIDMSFDENEFATTYMKYLGDGSFLFEGARKLIKDLSDKYILSIVTNGLTVVQERRIKKSSIAKCFKDIVISEEIGIAKPHPDIFEHAIGNLGEFNKDEILMIGDNLSSDIKGGINYNIDTCWYNPNKKENKKRSSLP